MSSLTQPNGDDYPSSALKHLEDSKCLLSNNRYDNAAYLSGYCVECSLKTLIQLIDMTKPYPHINKCLKDHFGTGLINHYNVIILSVPPKYAKYASHTSLKNLQSSSIANWKVTLRYQTTGMQSSSEARTWIQEAIAVYNGIINELILDGEITI